MPPARLARMFGVAATLALGPALPAAAQATASLSLTSDFTVRGVSLSDRRPAAGLSLSDDLANGAYLGATLLGQEAAGGHVRPLGHLEYAGYAFRRTNGLAWDVGVDNQDFRVATTPAAHVRYTEVYAGVSDGRFSARLFLAPDYLHLGVKVAYLDLGAAARPADGWRLSGHVGLFQPLAGAGGTAVWRTRYDGRLDLVRQFGKLDLGLALTAAAPTPAPEPKRGRPTLVATATAFF